MDYSICVLYYSGSSRRLGQSSRRWKENPVPDRRQHARNEKRRGTCRCFGVFVTCRTHFFCHAAWNSRMFGLAVSRHRSIGLFVNSRHVHHQNIPQPKCASTHAPPSARFSFFGAVVAPTHHTRRRRRKKHRGTHCSFGRWCIHLTLGITVLGEHFRNPPNQRQQETKRKGSSHFS